MSAGTLYTFSGSGNSYKVRLLAAVLNIELKHVEIDFLVRWAASRPPPQLHPQAKQTLQADEQHKPAFLAINPRGEVPTLVDPNGTTYTDSSAILVYLAGTYSDAGTPSGPSSFWSVDVCEQAAIVDWLSFANSWIQYGVFTPRAILSYGGPYNGLGTNAEHSQATLDLLVDHGARRGHASLRVLDSHLEGREWLALGRPTVADLSVFVYVALAPMGDISLEEYGNVKAWIGRVRGLKGFVEIEGLDDPLVRRR